MDFTEIEYFLTVASSKTFTAAADKLFISQSSLSKHMAQLERELGVKLFKKTRNGIELTQAGWDFHSYAQHALPEYQRAVSRLSMYQEHSTYPLVVGALPLVEDYGFADSFGAFWAKNTSVQLEYIERSQANLVDKLRRHKIDFALLRLDRLDRREFRCIPLVEDELALACSTKNPLSTISSTKVADLRNEQFILLEEKSDITQIFYQACENEGFHPNVPLHHSRHRMLLNAVQNNMGVTVLPRRMLTSYHASNIAIVAIEPTLKSTIGFAGLRKEPSNPVLHSFVESVCADYHVDPTKY